MQKKLKNNHHLMQKLHENLMKKNGFYAKWHKHPNHHIVQWLFLLLVTGFVGVLLINRINSPGLGSYGMFSSAHEQIPKTKGGKIGSAQDHILVKFKDGIGNTKSQEVLAKHNFKTQSEISQIKVKLVKIPSNQSPEEAVDSIKNQDSDSIEFAETDDLIAPSYVPNDPQYGSNWQLPKMSAETAWDSSRGSSSVIIAILDTGTDCTHEDLAPHCVPGWNFYDNNNNTADVHGHGTAVAGTAAAAGDNSLGISSPCFNCKIMPLRISDPTAYALWSTMATAITYAADHGARVANLSYAPIGGTVSSAAQYMMGKNGVVVNAAGNDGTTSTAGDDPNIIKVSAVDGSDVLYSWSTRGSDIDVAAAGCVTTTQNGGSYGGWCGTSLASPVVAGVAGLIISKNPSLSGAQIRDIIKNNTDDIDAPGFDINTGWGRPNMTKAIASAGGSTAPTPTPDTLAPSIPGNLTASVSGGSINLSWNPSTDNVGVKAYQVLRNGSVLASVSTTAYTDSGVSAGTSYNYTVTAVDAAGNISGASNTASAVVPAVSSSVVITGKTVGFKTSSSAVISWTTNIPSTGTVSYGIGSLGLSISDGTIGTSHSVTLTGLLARTNYSYKITAVSADGTSQVSSSTATFKTSPK